MKGLEMTDPRILSKQELFRIWQSPGLLPTEIQLLDHIDAITEERDRLRGLVERAVPILSPICLNTACVEHPFVHEWLRDARGGTK